MRGVGEEEDQEALNQDKIDEARRSQERFQLAHPRLRGRIERLLLEPELRLGLGWL